MKKLMIIALALILSIGVALAGGDQNQGTTGSGTLSTGSDSQGSGTQGRTGR